MNPHPDDPAPTERSPDGPLPPRDVSPRDLVVPRELAASKTPALDAARKELGSAIHIPNASPAARDPELASSKFEPRLGASDRLEEKSDLRKMMARHNKAAALERIALIGDDEPVFVIRGRDVLASSAILHWAQGMAAFGGRADKVALAEECAALCRVQPFRRLAD